VEVVISFSEELGGVEVSFENFGQLFVLF
jgi:hypothetical protein